eukprot:TRINITY_DN45341_c0_g1_i1.p1 TRINITY_DN45341_c0_g1~~TRINITY_DN45341_c0_g1_i1.p1  ORF type:complete len:919 (+),score=173.33 TRINITY_DN45341_c0_g1_i1:96-2759(+)
MSEDPTFEMSTFSNEILLTHMRVSNARRGTPTTYSLHIRDGERNWEITRRYKDFLRCNVKLLEEFQRLELPPFPPKEPILQRMFGSGFDRTGWAMERNFLLHDYINKLLQMPNVVKTTAFRDLLDLPRDNYDDSKKSEHDRSPSCRKFVTIMGVHIHLTGEPGVVEVVVRMDGDQTGVVRPSLVNVELLRLSSLAEASAVALATNNGSEVPCLEDFRSRLLAAETRAGLHDVANVAAANDAAWCRVEKLGILSAGEEASTRFELEPGTLWNATAVCAEAPDADGSVVSLQLRAPTAEDVAGWRGTNSGNFLNLDDFLVSGGNKVDGSDEVNAAKTLQAAKPLHAATIADLEISEATIAESRCDDGHATAAAEVRVEGSSLNTDPCRDIPSINVQAAEANFGDRADVVGGSSPAIGGCIASAPTVVEVSRKSPSSLPRAAEGPASTVFAHVSKPNAIEQQVAGSGAACVTAVGPTSASVSGSAIVVTSVVATSETREVARPQTTADEMSETFRTDKEDGDSSAQRFAASTDTRIANVGVGRGDDTCSDSSDGETSDPASVSASAPTVDIVDGKVAEKHEVAAGEDNGRNCAGGATDSRSIADDGGCTRPSDMLNFRRRSSGERRIQLVDEVHEVMWFQGSAAAKYARKVSESHMAAMERAPHRLLKTENEGTQSVPIRYSVLLSRDADGDEEAEVDGGADVDQPLVQKAFSLDDSREVQRLQEMKEQEKLAARWIHAVTGHEGAEAAATGEGSLEDALRSGEALCDLINAVWPGRIVGILRGEVKAFRRVENITRFLRVCEQLGVELDECTRFGPAELASGKNIARVVRCIFALDAQVPPPPQYSGPRLADFGSAGCGTPSFVGGASVDSSVSASVDSSRHMHRRVTA